METRRSHTTLSVIGSITRAFSVLVLPNLHDDVEMRIDRRVGMRSYEDRTFALFNQRRTDDSRAWTQAVAIVDNAFLVLARFRQVDRPRALSGITGSGQFVLPFARLGNGASRGTSPVHDFNCGGLESPAIARFVQRQKLVRELLRFHLRRSRFNFQFHALSYIAQIRAVDHLNTLNR